MRSQGVSPLHCAALMGHLSVVEVLYDYEPVVDVRDKQNATPLHKACKRDQSHVAEFFIRKVRSRLCGVCVWRVSF
jgi:ankyrin repeat protein